MASRSVGVLSCWSAPSSQQEPSKHGNHNIQKRRQKFLSPSTEEGQKASWTGISRFEQSPSQESRRWLKPAGTPHLPCISDVCGATHQHLSPRPVHPLTTDTEMFAMSDKIHKKLPKEKMDTCMQFNKRYTSFCCGLTSDTEEKLNDRAACKLISPPSSTFPHFVYFGVLCSISRLTLFLGTMEDKWCLSMMYSQWGRVQGHTCVGCSQSLLSDFAPRHVSKYLKVFWRLQGALSEVW